MEQALSQAKDGRIHILDEMAKALTGSRDCVKEMVKSYNSRRNLLVEKLKGINGINLVEPQGAFYAFPQITNSEIDSRTFCKLALERVGLVLVPGIAFGDNSCFRVSCAVSNKNIEKGIRLLSKLMTKL